MIAEFPVYGTPRHINCSSEFICMIMPDRKIISLLICDPHRVDNNLRISKLERKYIPEEGSELKQLQSNLLKKVSDTFGSSSHVNPSEMLRNIFNIGDEIKNDEKYNKIKKFVQVEKSIEYFCENMDQNKLERDWQINLMQKSE